MSRPDGPRACGRPGEADWTEKRGERSEQGEGKGAEGAEEGVGGGRGERTIVGTNAHIWFLSLAVPLKMSCSVMVHISAILDIMS